MSIKNHTLTLVLIFLVLILGSLPAAADTSRITWSWQDTDTKSRPGYGSLLPDGGIVLVRRNFEKPNVVEIDRGGTIVWQLEGISANSVEKLPGGNYLITDSGAPGWPKFPRVIEITPSKDVVWEYRFDSWAEAPQQATRLENGNILIVTPNRILELDRNKQKVWEFAIGLSFAIQAERLDSGNTLIVDRGIMSGAAILEVDSSGRVVWSYRAGLLKPVGAIRLQNGNTVIADPGNYWKMEISPEGEVVKTTSWRQVLAELGFTEQRYARPLEEAGTLVVAGNRAMVVDDRSVQVYLDNKWLPVPVSPIIVGGRVLVPVRSLADALGWQLNWQAEQSSLEVTDGYHSLMMKLNSNEVFIDGQPSILDAGPRLVDNIMVAPVRPLAEIFGLDLKWNPEMRVLELFSGQ